LQNKSQYTDFKGYIIFHNAVCACEHICLNADINDIFGNIFHFRRMTQTRKSRGRPREDKRDTPTNQSLERALGLLKTISLHDGMSLTDLSEATGLAPSTAHRLLNSLSGHELVSWEDTSQKWSIGIEALRIGMAFQRRNKILLAGRSEMTQLMQATGETVNMAMLDRFDVVFVSQVECEATIRAYFRIGERRAIHASGIGKALLAEMPDARVNDFLRTHKLSRFTPTTLTEPDAMRAELTLIRERGWSLDDEEANSGMRCIAAPVFNEFGEARAGISLSGPTTRLTQTRLAELGTMVKATAARITRLIGGHLLT
jgi:IclR family transcriptional regulator, acetate operon repressor